MTQVRVMHYLNQFFAGMGGEDKADMPFGSRQGPIGPGKRLQDLLGDSARIAVTVYCGDNYFADHHKEVPASIMQIAKDQDIQIVVAGPAFSAGRYGFACVEICRFLSTSLGLYGITAMHAENPGVDTYRQYKDRRVFNLPTADVIAGMEDALSRVAKFVLKLASGDTIGPASEEGYMPRGIRIDRVASESGADRTIDMLLNMLANRPFTTEIPIESFEASPINPPVAELKDACLALAYTGGIVPLENPDGFRVAKNSKWNKYSIDKLNSMKDVEWDVVAGGHNTAFVRDNPNYGVPLDVCREIERRGILGEIYPYFYSTNGGTTTIADMKAVGMEMAHDMSHGSVGAVLLVST